MVSLLVALNPGETATPAFKRARELASALRNRTKAPAAAPAPGVQITLYCAVHDSHIADRRAGDSAPVNLIQTAMLDAARTKLDEAASHLTALCESVRIQVDWEESAATGIVNAATACGADLIIATAGHHGRLARLVFEHTDWELMRNAPMPVLFAREGTSTNYAQVLAAVDPMRNEAVSRELDRQVVRAAAWFADLFAGRLCLGHAFPDPGALAMAEYVPPPDVFDRWRDEHELQLTHLADEVGVAAEQVYLVPGEPARAIPTLARTLESNLVVLGSVSRSRLAQWMIGANTQKILAAVPGDALVVRAQATGAIVAA